VATSITTRVSKHVRTLLCVMIAASLSAPFAPQTSSSGDRHHSVHRLDVASVPATIQANRGGTRLVEGARQQTGADTAFLAVRIDHSPQERGHFAPTTNEFSFWQFAVRNRPSGRSPPLIA
jgi:hypothetical protein